MVALDWQLWQPNKDYKRGYFNISTNIPNDADSWDQLAGIEWSASEQQTDKLFS